MDKSATCPLCGEGWPEKHDWITDEMVAGAWTWLLTNCPAEGPTLLMVDKHDVRAAVAAALSVAARNT